jgi:pyroglutamyl-peptidase
VTIRLLVTGFTPFPGAPFNPTERLIRHFEAEPPLAGEDVEWRFAVLPVDYANAVPVLEAAAAAFEPHVAVHFGLARNAAGFRLERLARNEIASVQPDNAGTVPAPSPIRHGAGHVRSSLPLETIAEALQRDGHRVEWSDDAGGYLCNYVFFHSAAGLCRGLSAPVSGFVHVGAVNLPGTDSSDMMMDFSRLVEGAGTILEICVAQARGL